MILRRDTSPGVGDVKTDSVAGCRPGTVADDLPSIVADRLAVEQVFGNLIDNALKYLDPARPGTIEVTARPAPGNRIRFDVSDT
jgi:signal transduction histidine kinase